MEFLDLEIEKYIEAHTSEENTLLQQINRDTHLEVMRPRMLSGHVQGRLLSLFSKMISPKNILEIGTYTGYSAICMAEGLQKDGQLITIDVNEELEDRVNGYFEQAGLTDQVEFKIGNAMEIIPTLTQQFDLVFIDADKSNYSNYLDLVVDKVPAGGYIIADNVLWSGKVVEKFRKSLDKDTEALLKFNKEVHQDDRFENVLLGVRDGLMILRKK
jgi:predicted O-methyltransferase YrrM